MTRPRAADDFGAIRARMEELRRERARLSGDGQIGPGPRPYHPATERTPQHPDRRLPRSIRRKLFG